MAQVRDLAYSFFLYFFVCPSLFKHIYFIFLSIILSYIYSLSCSFLHFLPFPRFLLYLIFFIHFLTYFFPSLIIFFLSSVIAFFHFLSQSRFYFLSLCSLFFCAFLQMLHDYRQLLSVDSVSRSARAVYLQGLKHSLQSGCSGCKNLHGMEFCTTSKPRVILPDIDMHKLNSFLDLYTVGDMSAQRDVRILRIPVSWECYRRRQGTRAVGGTESSRGIGNSSFWHVHSTGKEFLGALY